ncbi:MAG: hypothetical protein ABW022_24550 [Actinoplanes sp.]
MLVLVVMVPIVGLWLAMSRQPRSRWIVAATLVGITAAAFALGLVLPRAAIELTLAAPALGALTVIGGRLFERRRLRSANGGSLRRPAANDDQPHPPADGGGRLVAPADGGGRLGAPALLLGVLVLVEWAVVLVVSVPTTFRPAADKVLPLPDGMRAAVAPHDDSACDSVACRVRIDVTGRAGQSGAELEAELTRHLKARGWGDGCRPVGWLLDGSTECVELAADGNRATILLLGNRENVREKTL